MQLLQVVFLASLPPVHFFLLVGTIFLQTKGVRKGRKEERGGGGERGRGGEGERGRGGGERRFTTSRYTLLEGEGEKEGERERDVGGECCSL